MYKIIVSDLDGTLLNSNGVITDYTKDIINSLSSKSIKFVIATGRHYLDVVDICNKNNIKALYITANGSSIHDENNKLIYYKKLNNDVLIDIIKNLYDNDEIYMNIFCNNLWIVSLKSSLKRYYVKNMNINDLLKDEYIINNSCKIHFNSKNISLLSYLKTFLEKNWNDYINVNFSLPFCLEVNPKNISKGNTLKYLLNILNFKVDECISFGDGMNDYEMLSITKKSCIMKNSSEELKKKMSNSDIIDTNDNDGVAKYIYSNIINK